MPKSKCESCGKRYGADETMAWINRTGSRDCPNCGSDDSLRVDYSEDEGCYIATAVYGSYDSSEVWILRKYRDNTLLKTFYGRIFVKFYYFISPTLVKLFGEKKWFKEVFKSKLDVFIDKLEKQI